ncbi:hypothetical protein ACVIIW_000086 [Bradyrhizobium sp. USDA 4449]
MSKWKTAIACSLTAAVLAGQIGQAAAAPLPTNVATMKATVGDDVTQVYWRGRGFGWGFGGFAAGALIGSAIAGAPYGYYGGYGYPGYGYGYAPAYYGYGPAYPGYYRPYRPYYGYRYGYYRPYYRPYYRHYW